MACVPLDVVKDCDSDEGGEHNGNDDVHGSFSRFRRQCFKDATEDSANQMPNSLTL